MIGTKPRKQLRILVAEDHEIVRVGLRTLIESQPSWTIVGEVSNGREAVEVAKREKPDVVVLDISMPELNGLEAARRIHQSLPQTKILVLSVHAGEDLMQDILRVGAQGYVLKSDAGRDLICALHSVVEGKPYFTSKAAKLVLTGFLQSNNSSAHAVAGSKLSPREREVIQLLAEGKSNKEVADILGVSVHTAETHRTAIMRKLGFSSVVDLVRYAIRNKIIEP